MPFLRRFLRNRKGATAIEFTLIGPIFLAMLFSMIEVAWLMARMTMVNHAVQVAAKEIYTGKNVSREDLGAVICDHALLIPNCSTNVNVEAIQMTAFTDIPDTTAECRDSGDPNFNPVSNYSTGSGGQIVFLRVCMAIELVTPGLGFGASLPTLDNGKFAIVSSTAFLNEPF